MNTPGVFTWLSISNLLPGATGANFFGSPGLPV